MKAAVYRKYGPPSVVQIEDIPKPIPKDNEALIKVRAASVNPLDWKVMSGGPYIIRTLLALGQNEDQAIGS
jgi:NADPH:quinone reductase-like Zn-dependent oxidoreductase